jgi:hypothetical protein
MSNDQNYDERCLHCRLMKAYDSYIDMHAEKVDSGDDEDGEIEVDYVALAITKFIVGVIEQGNSQMDKEMLFAELLVNIIALGSRYGVKSTRVEGPTTIN